MSRFLPAAVSAAALSGLLLLGGTAPADATWLSFDKGEGTCKALTARYDPASLWFGWVSAQGDGPNGGWRGGSKPFYAEGCFRTEIECRRFVNEGLSFSNGRLIGMKCEPGVPPRALR
ncbi:MULTISPECIES: hypothetical protein [Afifella]|uniref:hypothetical protein n=1 Tax=Afifella TaxID=643217 RepID=UPI000FE2CF5A|nr:MULTISPECIES: hypothetical protein [Afifella]MCT8266847.1 hypothetical protein [Afifella sp. JA880]